MTRRLAGRILRVPRPRQRDRNGSSHTRRTEPLDALRKHACSVEIADDTWKRIGSGHAEIRKEFLQGEADRPFATTCPRPLCACDRSESCAASSKRSGHRPRRDRSEAESCNLSGRNPWSIAAGGMGVIPDRFNRRRPIAERVVGQPIVDVIRASTDFNVQANGSQHERVPAFLRGLGRATQSFRCRSASNKSGIFSANLGNAIAIDHPARTLKKGSPFCF